MKQLIKDLTVSSFGFWLGILAIHLACAAALYHGGGPASRFGFALGYLIGVNAGILVVPLVQTAGDFLSIRRQPKRFRQ